MNVHVSMNTGSNATVSKAKSSAEPPRRMKPNTIVMSSRSSENDETEAMERCKVKKREKGRVP